MKNPQNIAIAKYQNMLIDKNKYTSNGNAEYNLVPLKDQIRKHFEKQKIPVIRYLSGWLITFSFYLMAP